MGSGVGKSGSPAPKLITSSPAARRALARASIAKVADSATAPTRRETPLAPVLDVPRLGVSSEAVMVQCLHSASRTQTQ